METEQSHSGLHRAWEECPICGNTVGYLACDKRDGSVIHWRGDLNEYPKSWEWVRAYGFKCHH